MEASVVEFRGVAKAYGRGALFENVSLAVRRGVCCALTGRNGAGKTTLLKIAGGLVSITAGEVRRSKKLSIGYVPEQFPRLNMTARQFVRHLAAIEGMSRAETEAGLRLFDDFFMDDLCDQPMNRLSKGTLQKVAVVQALMRPRDLLLLDEPLSGQDEPSQRVFIEKVLAMKRAGTGVLLSCHEPFLVERLADEAYRVGPEGLIRVQAGEALTRRVLLAFEPNREIELPEGVTCWRRDGRLYLSAPAAACDRIIIQMIEAGYSLKEMRDEDSL